MKKARSSEPGIESPLLDLIGAAKWLKCSPRTLERWIQRKRFAAADGLRRLGDPLRFHLPTMRACVAAGTIMSGLPSSTVEVELTSEDAPPARKKRNVVAAA